jgi:hypothetical protein
VPVLVYKRLITCGFFKRIEICSLNVLDDRKLKRLGIRDLQHDDRNVVQGRALSGTPTPLAGDDLEGVGPAARWSDNYWLNNASLSDRSGQLFELGLRKVASRIVRIGTDELDRQPPLAAAPLGRGGLAPNVTHQRREPAPESRPRRIIGHHGIPRIRHLVPALRCDDLA